MKKFMMILMAVALIALPTMAQQQEWQSTSAMKTSGSNYTPQVNAIGAESAQPMATTTTTESYSPENGPRKQKSGYDDLFDTGPDTGQSAEFPIGDAMLPLMLMAVVFSGVVALRRKRSAE